MNPNRLGKQEDSGEVGGSARQGWRINAEEKKPNFLENFFGKFFLIQSQLNN
jgi:hypothetical protein